MNINRIANRITSTYIMDPYAMLMHYKRAFKLMKVMKDKRAKILMLGNKNQFGIDWKGRFSGMDFDTGIVDERVISSAPRHYQLVLCLDPVLYCRSLRKINIPVMMCATAREITQHPEILEVTDYLLPSPSSRHDAALRQLVMSQIDSEEKPGEAQPTGGGEGPSREASASGHGGADPGRRGDTPEGTPPSGGGRRNWRANSPSGHRGAEPGRPGAEPRQPQAQ